MKKRIVLLVLTLLFIGCSQAPVDREVISTPNAPGAVGPYSQAVRIGNMLYLSGQLGLDPQTGEFAGSGFEAQAHQALENLKTVLEAAGYSMKDVVQCQVFVKDMNSYSEFNRIYTEYFDKDFPARAVLEVSRIPKDGLIEIMMVAVKTK